jgi:predicted TIM-barrel fold metal-dependent hydrolase
MAEYDNLWADLSAGSGYNALNRDPGFTPGFLDRHWRKLLFGTDVVWPGQPLPIVQWMKTVDLPADRRQAIMSGNARRLLRLEG